MPPARLFTGDEELGKKDDEYRPGKRQKGHAWSQRRLPYAPHRRSLKKVALGVLAVIGLYYFFKNMPKDLQHPSSRPAYGGGIGQPMEGPRPHSNEGTKPKPGHEVPAEPKKDFNGPIKFYQLASTLHGVSRMGGASPSNRNVLFAAASLKSAATLLPIACDMALRERSYVHFALMGRDDISMDILKAVNGVTKECEIIYHDARPDFALHSTEFRMEVASSAAFNHINKFLHPQATLVDSSGEEEIFFLRGLNDKAASLGRTVIELPEGAEKTLMWITLLDSASLSVWNSVTVDLVVHAPQSSSGSLMRLLESLKKADFFSSTPPRLTIELPHKIDGPTKQYLESFKWPKSQHGNLLTLHHRIPQHGLSAEENSIRFLESFWPASPSTSHVLVLSPQAELSPLFFHYLKYAMLEYKYSGQVTALHDNMMGLSLDLPSTYLNDTTSFEPPTTPFLWQAPNSNAALYFGEKWVELHDFVTHLLESQHKLPTPTTLFEKQVSKTYPSWLEHVLKLARARGYWTVYPSFDPRDSLVTRHNELYQRPEEYSNEVQEEQASEGDLTADPKTHISLRQKESGLASSTLLNILPSQGALPSISEMSLLRWDGVVLSWRDMYRGASEFTKVFRREIGGCKDDDKELEIEVGQAGNLFCLAEGP